MGNRKGTLKRADVEEYIGKAQELQRKCLNAYHFSVDTSSYADYFDGKTNRLCLTVYYKREKEDDMRSYDFSEYMTQKEAEAQYTDLLAKLEIDEMILKRSPH